MLLLLLAFGLAGCEGPPVAEFVKQIPWMEEGQWIKADTHIHTQFSDGNHSIDEIALQAKTFGCQAIAITDHADRNLKAATPDYAEAIRVARRSHPGLIILAGLEWNVPPWGGDEHATLLVPPGPDEFLTLSEFKRQFDDLGRDQHDPERALAAFRWLSQSAESSPLPPLIFFNHPGRAAFESQEVAATIAQWRKHTDLVVGFSGAPGHQKAEGAYRGKVSLLDRWDPAAAEVGGAWDQLLAQGEDVWAARAPSDFHSPRNDYWPGEFSETWLYVPERTAAGVLKAYRAGAFFAGHGQIARNVEFRIQSAGLSRPAYAGETIRLSTGANLTIELELDVPSTDWEGQPNQIDRIELIAVTSEGTRVIAEKPLPTGKPFTYELRGLQADCILRARGRRVVPDGPDLLFYTNPIRIVAVRQSLFTKIGRRMAKWITWRRLWGSGMALLLTASLIVWLYKHTSWRKKARKGPAESSPQTAPKRLHFFLAGLGFSLLAVYGSFVPLNLRPVTWEQAWEYFWYYQNWSQPDFRSRSDWGANILLFIPIGFCWLGTVCIDRNRRLWNAVSAGFVFTGCVLCSLTVEFFQCWFDARVPSHNDVYAQMIGTLIGISFWFAFGQTLIDWWRLHTKGRNRQHLLSSLLSVYVIGFIAYSLVPLDIIIHPAELYRKYQAGRIGLVPDWPSRLSKEGLWDSFTDLMAFLPVGVWSGVIWTSPEQRRPWIHSVLIGAMVAVLIEGAQLFLLSRYCELADVLIGILGVAIGAAGIWWYQSRTSVGESSQESAAIPSLYWISGSVLYATFLFCFHCWPLELDHDPARIHKAWDRFFRMPLTALYWSSEYNAATQILRKLLLWGVLGALMSQPVLKADLPKVLRRVFLIGLLMICAAFGTGIELIQLLMPLHTPDSTDIGLYSLGATLGIWISVWWHRPNDGPIVPQLIGAPSRVSSAD